MNRTLVSMLSVAALLWCGPAVAEDGHEELSIERTSWAESIGSERPVVVDNPWGDVRLRFGGWQGVLEVQGVLQQPGDGGARLVVEVETDDDRIVVRVAARIKEGASTDVLAASRARADVVAMVPAGPPVRVSTAGGLIDGKGVRGDLTARSESGAVRVREIHGTLDLESDRGELEATLVAGAAGRPQRLVTVTGDITVYCADAANLDVRLATSGTLTTDFSLEVEHRDGEEPDKRAAARVGAGGHPLELESRRGALALRRLPTPHRAASIPAAGSATTE